MPIYTNDTGNRPCPYIEGEIARFLVHIFNPEDPKISQEKYWEQRRAFKLGRIKAGYFNQSEGAGEFKCPSCRKCFSTAVKIDEYSPSKSQKKLLRKNKDLKFSFTEPFATREAYDLFQDYLRNRHPDSNMLYFSFEEFRDKVMGHSSVAILKLNNKVIAMSLIDSDSEIIVGDYCFYNTAISKERSLGTLMDLKILEYAQEKKVPFTSFGAINNESPKLKHKGNYSGTYISTDSKWSAYDKPKP